MLTSRGGREGLASNFQLPAHGGSPGTAPRAIERGDAATYRCERREGTKSQLLPPGAANDAVGKARNPQIHRTHGSETSSYFLMLFRHSYCSESHAHQLAPLGRSSQKAYCVAVKSPRIHSSKCKPSFPPHGMRLPLPPYYYISYPCK